MLSIKLKTIHIVRHAKSSWKDMQLTDHDRPLNQRGLRDAPFMAKKLFDAVGTIDLWVCSSSVRTRQTCQFFVDHFTANNTSKTPIVSFKPTLYHGSISDYFSVIHEMDNQLDSAIVFGHNYTVTDIANMFAKEPIENVPTCGIVSLQFMVDNWSDIGPRNGVLTSFTFPKMYK